MAAQSDKPDRQIEEDLRIFQGAICRWREEIKKHPANAFPGTGYQTSLEEENRR
ncbi:MAG TPA: hypothetical protein VKY57_09400 [Chitinispirillaceae bacterium]|nr:hypothetical protein [Chitinispirillaceae bacterium]